MLASLKKAFSAKPSEQQTQSESQIVSDKVSVTMSKSQKVQKFLQLIKQRRSIYALNNTPILPDAELISLIKTTVRESPSAFNSQSSRVVILLGEDHKNYWQNIVKPAMRKTITDETFWSKLGPRYDLFAQAYGTALFFEDENAIKKLQQEHAVVAKSFPHWSAHASGMAQLNTWTALEVAGYGANLQHVSDSNTTNTSYNAHELTYSPFLKQNIQAGPATIVEKYGVPTDWTLQAELVFGNPTATPSEKTYMDDTDRFKVFGSK